MPAAATAVALTPWDRAPLRTSNPTTDPDDPAPVKPTHRLPQAPVFVHRGPVARARRIRRVSLDLDPPPHSPLPTSPVSSAVDVCLAPPFTDRHAHHLAHAPHYAVFTEIDTAVDLSTPDSPPLVAPAFPSFAEPVPSALALESVGTTSSSAATCVIRSAASLLAAATTTTPEPVLRPSVYALRGDEACELDIDGAEVVSDEEDVEIRAHGPRHTAVPTKDGHGELIFARGTRPEDDRLLTRDSHLVDRRTLAECSPLSSASASSPLASSSLAPSPLASPTASSDRRSIELGNAAAAVEQSKQSADDNDKRANKKKSPRRRLRFPRLRQRESAPTPHRFADLPEDDADFFDADPTPPSPSHDEAAASRKSSLRADDGGRRASISSRLRAHLSFDGREPARRPDRCARDNANTARPRRTLFVWFRPRVTPDLTPAASFVRNVSLAKDDFIEFATSTAVSSQRRPWFMRRPGPPAITGPSPAPPALLPAPTFASPPPVALPLSPADAVGFPVIEPPPAGPNARKSMDMEEAAVWGL